MNKKVFFFLLNKLIWILFLILRILSKETSLSLKRLAVRCLSFLCRGKKIQAVEFRKVEPALPVLVVLLNNQDEEILIDACEAFSYLSDAINEETQKIIKRFNVCPRLVELLNHSSFEIVKPAMHAMQNMVTGIGREAQIQAVLDCNALECLLKLLNSDSGSIRNEACLVMGCIAAGNIAQKQV